MNITIRTVGDLDGCCHFQELQRQVWASPDDDLVPHHVTVTVIKNGGALLGAYADDGPPSTGGMVGAAFWWLGAGRPTPQSDLVLKVCSHIVGVLPAWQGRGIGLQLKLAQRQAVLSQGITDWISWTYDPLYRTNGVFNMHRLGATCHTYARNVYGEIRDALNAGVPSDRCQVDWRLNSAHVLARIQPQRLTRAWDFANVTRLPSTRRPDGIEQPTDIPLALDGGPIAVPVPLDIAAIRANDQALSLAWRFYMRHVLEEAFQAGYAMVDCVLAPDKGWVYILVRL